MKARYEQPSAVSGETSPLLSARTDLAKFQSGARRVSNMVVLPEGARTRRPGTQFLTALDDETTPAVFVPFEGGQGKAHMLVFDGGKLWPFVGGDNAGRVATATGGLYSIALPFDPALLDGLRWTQSLDTMFFALAGGAPQKLVRYDNADWAWSAYSFERGPFKTQNVDQTKTIQASAATGNITLTASAAMFLPQHVGSLWKLAEQNTGDIAVWKIAVNYKIGDRVRWQGRIYEVITAGDSGDYAPQHDEGDVKSGGSATATGCVYRFLSFDNGFVRILAVTSPTIAEATVVRQLPPAVVASATYRWSAPAWHAGAGWPSVVAIVDQSLLWGRDNEIWLSETTDIYGFEQSTEEDTSLNFRFFSPDGRSCDFRWAMNAGSLLLGTSTGEWVVRGPSTYDRLTAQNARGFLQSSEGSSGVQPVAVAGGAVFVGRGRNRLNFAKFDYISDRIEIQEFTTFSRHMLKAKAKQLAWQGDPHRILWVLLDDGTLAAVTLRPDQEVTGWHRHHIKGAFIEQIACVQAPNGERTDLWLQTRHENANGTRRYIEILRPYFEAADPENPTAAGAWYLDSALRYDGPPTRQIQVSHLLGRNVRVFVDNMGDLGQFTVDPDTGMVALPVEVSSAVIGLPIEWETESLPIDVNTQAGPSKGRKKTPGGVHLHVHEAALATVSVNGSRPSEILRTPAGADYGPVPLTSGLERVEIEPVTAKEMTLRVSGETALPFTLLGFLVDVDVREA